jgi:4-hydroxy-tetrahydrodipicolinate reductase
MVKIGILGCTGRVGTILTSELLSGDHSGITLAGGTSRRASDTHSFLVTDNPEKLMNDCDVAIDFTLPEALQAHLEAAVKTNTALVIATTGLSNEQELAIQGASRSVPIVYAANTSIGVTLLQSLVHTTAASLGEEFDIEIVETHHKHKVDAPSGTALALGKAAAKGRQVNLDDKAVYERCGHTGERKAGDIGFGTLRGGDVVGEH